MRTCFVCAALMTAVVPARAAAQTAALTESEVVTQIGNESPRVQAARAVVDVARADIPAAGRWPNPRFTFNREAVAGVAENMFMVAQPLPITGRRQLDVRAATMRVEASAQRADDHIRRVRAEARRSVCTFPGCRQLTMIPCGRPSKAMPCVSPHKPNFEALYGALPSRGR